MQVGREQRAALALVRCAGRRLHAYQHRRRPRAALPVRVVQPLANGDRDVAEVEVVGLGEPQGARSGRTLLALDQRASCGDAAKPVEFPYKRARKMMTMRLANESA